MGQFAENDPTTMYEATKVVDEAANRWTVAYECSANNIFTLREWCSKNFPQAKEQLEILYNEDIVQFMVSITLLMLSLVMVLKCSPNGLIVWNQRMERQLKF